MTAMSPRTPTASPTIGILYNASVAYNSPLTYNQTVTSGLMFFVAKPTASTKSRTVATATMKVRN